MVIRTLLHHQHQFRLSASRLRTYCRIIAKLRWEKQSCGATHTTAAKVVRAWHPEHERRVCLFIRILHYGGARDSDRPLVRVYDAPHLRTAAIVIRVVQSWTGSACRVASYPGGHQIAASRGSIRDITYFTLERSCYGWRHTQDQASRLPARHRYMPHRHTGSTICYRRHNASADNRSDKSLKVSFAHIRYSQLRTC